MYYYYFIFYCQGDLIAKIATMSYHGQTTFLWWISKSVQRIARSVSSNKMIATMSYHCDHKYGQMGGEFLNQQKEYPSMSTATKGLIQFNEQNKKTDLTNSRSMSARE